MSSPSLSLSIHSTRLFPLLRQVSPECLGLAAIAAIDAVWAQRIGLRLIFGWWDFGVIAILSAVACAMHLAGQYRARLIAQYLALSLAMNKVFVVLSYLCLATSGDLVDRQLLAADHALGFSWLAAYQLITAYPLAARLLDLLYESLYVQAIYLCALLALMRRENVLRELFWLTFIAGILTNLLSIPLPAYGPFKVFAISAHAPFLPEILRLKSAHDLTFEMSKMTGVISFPSFHTVMALAYAYSARKTGVIGYVFLCANALMLIAVPFFGGHYLVDMIAGAAVMLVSLFLVRARPFLLPRQAAA